jgi:hypothetical protein
MIGYQEEWTLGIAGRTVGEDGPLEVLDQFDHVSIGSVVALVAKGEHRNAALICSNRSMTIADAGSTSARTALFSVPLPSSSPRYSLTRAQRGHSGLAACAWSSWPRQPATDTGSIRTPRINQGRGSTGVGHT